MAFNVTLSMNCRGHIFININDQGVNIISVRWLLLSVIETLSEFNYCLERDLNIYLLHNSGIIMVLVVDGNSERGVHVLSDFGNLICKRHPFRSTAVTNLKPCVKKDLFTPCNVL